MKRLILAFAVAAVIILIVTLIELHNFKEGNYLRLSVKHHGGEITIEDGPALHAVHTYPMTEEGTASHHFVFAPFNLLISLAVLTAAIFGLITLGTVIFRNK
ncbi:MAG: hypothetical protein IJM18_08160 [Clostridia bacterium]|nr:hypothetical protein [Clostridia bacterium]